MLNGLTGGWFTGGWILVSLVLMVMLLGVGLTLIYGVFRGLLACLRVTPWLLSWTWAKLTGKPLDSHGSAHFSSVAEVEASGLLNDTGIALAQLPDGRVLREPLGQGVALVAPPRSRKSWSWVRPAIVGFEGTVVASDPRGELYGLCQEARAARGPVYRYAPGDEQSCILDPMDTIEWGSLREYADLDRLVHTLLREVADQSEANQFRRLAQPWLRALLVDHHQRRESLAHIRHWIDDPQRTEHARVDALVKSPLPTVAEGGAAMRQMLQHGNLFISIMAALRSALEVFAEPLISQHTTGPSDLRLSSLQAGLRPSTLFLTSEFADQDRLMPLLSALIAQMIALWSGQGHTRRQRILLILDEAMNLGRIGQLESGVSYLSGCGVQVALVFQNTNQVLRTYGEHTPLLDAIPTRLYFTPTDQVTKEEISSALGMTTNVYDTVSQSVDTFGLLQRRVYGQQRTARPLRFPDEVARLSDDACYLVTKGHAPLECLKLDATPAALALAIQQAKPVVKRVALATAACLVAGLLGAWLIWPSAQAKPSLSLTPLAWVPPGAVPTPEVVPPPTPAEVRQHWVDQRVATMQTDGWTPERVEAQKTMLQGLADAMNPEDRETRVMAESSRHRARFQLWKTVGTFQPFAMSAIGYPTLEQCQTALTTAKASDKGTSPLWGKMPEKYKPPTVTWTCALIDDAS